MVPTTFVFCWQVKINMLENETIIIMTFLDVADATGKLKY